MPNITDITEADERQPLIPQRADPYVYYHKDGYYYFTASVPEYDRIEIRRAWSVKGLADAQPLTVWRKHAAGPMSWHIWAPELHYINGKWFIYFAAGQAEDPWYIRMWVLENDSPDPFTGEWKEKGLLIPEWDSFSLDCTVFENHGKHYAVWAQKRKERTENSALYIAEMITPYTLKLPQTMITVPEYDWECRGFKVNEGPAVLQRNGKIFLTYSASATDATYCMGMLVAEDGADLTKATSWKKLEKPVFVTDEKAGIYGPGHNSFTTNRDGTQDYLIYHARPYAEVDLNFALYDPNRHTWVKRIRYDSNGYPVFQ
ncbi:MAG: glycoside hydrolase family 43 protein [Treponema sp.]|nr:glycoside hydrolase family 43 protein [Treponema sp.]